MSQMHDVRLASGMDWQLERCNICIGISRWVLARMVQYAERASGRLEPTRPSTIQTKLLEIA
eukprot:2255996-Amphidinium_carterae.1